MKTVPAVLHLDYFHLKFLYYMKIVSLSWTIQSNLGNNLKNLLKTNYLCFPWENLKWNKTLVNIFWNLTSCLYKLNVWSLHLYNAKFTTMLLNYFLYKKPPQNQISHREPLLRLYESIIPFYFQNQALSIEVAMNVLDVSYAYLIDFIKWYNCC